MADDSKPKADRIKPKDKTATGKSRPRAKATKKTVTDVAQSPDTSQEDTAIQMEQQAFGVSKAKENQTPNGIEGLLAVTIKQLLQEQRRSRRWSIFFKVTYFALAVFVLLALFDVSGGGSVVTADDDEFTAVVEVHGIIAPGEFTSADKVIDNLRSAFEHEGTRGVIIDINSPGGSPVQSGQIYDEIVRLQTKYPETKVYAVISDLGASGGYYVAAAADEIYADKSSLVGSIGVIFSSFGYTGLMEKLGVERRLVVAGRNKAFLDPFSPEDANLTKFWQDVLAITHKQFIDSVVKKRGDKLVNKEQIFSGLLYNAEQALEIGLVDSLGDKRYVAREVIGYEDLRYFENEEDQWIELVRRFGSAVATAFTNALTNTGSNQTLR